ncbi:MAG: hypothetical protein COA84_00270 [Robiginitomaculum sp.]|nr:MAG: hypothetical protein COA84_00270 [Robiginitomaculum sp.]
MQTRQLWLDLAPKGGAYRRETFVEGQSNAQARKALAAWKDWAGGLLALTGPSGCGKSHLTQLWAEDTGAVQYDLAHLSRTLRGCLYIEDLPTGLDETALFRLINAAAAGEVHVLLTSMHAPRQWPNTLPDLTSRLAAMPTIAIDEPDDVVLTGVLRKLFTDRQIAVNQPVIDYLLSRMERSTAAALTTVERIHAKGHDLKQNIRLPLVRTVMAEIEQEETT